MIFLPFVDKHFVLPPAIEECHLPGFVMGDGAKIISNLDCAAASSPLRCVTDEHGRCYGRERFPAAELGFETIFTDDSETEIKYL